jgi:hypothetical protein
LGVSEEEWLVCRYGGPGFRREAALQERRRRSAAKEGKGVRQARR